MIGASDLSPLGATQGFGLQANRASGPQALPHQPPILQRVTGLEMQAASHYQELMKIVSELGLRVAQLEGIIGQ